MADQHEILLLGGTGRTGSRVLLQLLERNLRVRAIVRTAAKIPPEAARNALLGITEAELLSLSHDELVARLRGCDAVISCLGHVISFRGIFGRPRDLVTQAVKRLCTAVETLRPATPLKVVLMSSVSVNSPYGREARRGLSERAFLWVLRGLLPPAKDNQSASDLLFREAGVGNPRIEWVAVRPDSLIDGPVSGYALHESLVNALFAPGQTSRANVAHFMCELVTNPAKWAQWRFKLPVIVNADTPA